ncbi:glycosyltransferase family 4 protein [Paraburkholderia sabiae]|uniref:Glycosyltransferase family 4 protein n=1 Tax=Paraburkholderia sabiae TaxID=273251 RepID=A0ABU9QBX6_9BURK|nr:glycosyltransferase family 4 protein [Paraburkholderia sabiae]WJZ75816.1 glycosyltransferase family 4 protein [Paraburkholderia sabiae]CAD6561401.1 D-inositol-3-phosphate glycosyltransferase [Paraburkholderia sabiae]
MEKGTVRSRSIKSLQIGMHWFPERAGGLDRMYYSLIGALPGAGVEVRGVVAGSERVAHDTNGAINGFGSAAQSLPLRLMAARRALRREIREQHPDVISSHFALYTFPGLDVTRGIPQISHFHGPWSEESHVEGPGSLGRRIKRYLERTVYVRSSRLIVLSDAFGKILTSRYGIPADRVRVVPGCVNVDQFNLPLMQNEARLRLQLPLGRPIVLAVRRLVRRMGLEDLIDAVKIVKRRNPDVLLLIAGKGRLHEELQQRIDDAGLGDNVKLLGFVPDEYLAALYRAADISVVPTVALEGFGLITVESLASGTPVLVTPVGGLPEAVAGLSQDLVLPSTGADAIADGLGQVLDGSLRLPDADACSRYARVNFDNTVIAEKVAKVYEEAVGAY